MNPLRLFSKVAASSPKKLSFDNVGSLVPAEVSDPCESAGAFEYVSPPRKTMPSRGTRKRGQLSSPAASEAGSPPKLPTPGRGKSSKTTPRSCNSTGKLGGHQHRRSLSNLPRLDNGSAGTAADFPPGRSLRQSASFSGISAPRGGRPPTSGEIGTGSPLFGTSSTSIATPRSAGKSVRYKPAKSLVANGYSEEPRIELKEDPTFWMDHSVQVRFESFLDPYSILFYYFSKIPQLFRMNRQRERCGMRCIP
jgi:hypothetical protein